MISFEKIFIYLLVIIILHLKKIEKCFPKYFRMKKKMGWKEKPSKQGGLTFNHSHLLDQFNVLEAPTCPFLKKQMFEKKDDLVRA
jgi:hypothetical protein